MTSGDKQIPLFWGDVPLPLQNLVISYSANSATRQTRLFGVLEVQIAKLGRPSLVIALSSARRRIWRFEGGI